MGKSRVGNRRKSRQMPRANEALKDFFSDNKIFADLFNAYAFQGAEVLHACDLMQVDSAYMNSVEAGTGIEKIGKYRDIARRCAFGTQFIILGIESQSKIHYAMPIRVMLYDVLEYTEECKRNSAIQSREKWTTDELLSGMRKGTKLMPVFTIIFYTGENKWDGPRTLHEMLFVHEQMKPFISDYHVNLIDVGHDDETRNFQTRELKELCSILQMIYNNTKGLEETKASNSIWKLAGILTDSRELYQMKGRDGTMACQAILKIRKQGAIEMLFSLVHDKLLSLEEGARRAEMAVDIFEEEMKRAGY